MHEAEDGPILGYAAQEKRTVVTLDRDFPQILALSGASTPSVVLIRRERLRAVALVALLQEVWSQHERSLDEGCVLSVGAYGTRIRPLPLT
jgi:predicted nuclease of predicted toxin-antitoxin system